jgi:hypothetical protein
MTYESNYSPETTKSSQSSEKTPDNRRDSNRPILKKAFRPHLSPWNTPAMEGVAAHNYHRVAALNPKFRQFNVSPVQVILHVVEYFGTPINLLMGADQTKSICVQRWIAMFLCHQFCKINSAAEIARHFNFDHSSVLYALRRLDAIMDIGRTTEHGEEIRRDVNAIICQMADEYGWQENKTASAETYQFKNQATPRPGFYMCTICNEVPVDVTEGIDTCARCLKTRI